MEKKYVDGYVLAVEKKKLVKYKKMAEEGRKMWIKHGALEYFECVGEDLSPDMGSYKVLTFPKMAKAKPNETVIFSFIVYKSRQHRDRVNTKVMKEMAVEMEKQKDKSMPFDMKRMAYGGFKVIVEEHNKK